MLCAAVLKSGWELGVEPWGMGGRKMKRKVGVGKMGVGVGSRELGG